MAKKEKYFLVRLKYSVPHPDFPDVKLSPKTPFKCNSAVKDALGDAVLEEEEITFDQFEDREE